MTKAELLKHCKKCKGHGFLSVQHVTDSWLKVEDELPDVIGNYLISGGIDSRYVAWAFFNSNGEWVDFSTNSFYANVTHWQPLSDPPKGVI